MPSRCRFVCAVCQALVTFVASQWSAPQAALAQDVRPGPQVRRELFGAVTDSATKQPLSGVAVSIAGTAVSARTDDAGRYRVAGFFAGSVLLVVRQVGFAPANLRLTLTTPVVETNIALVRRVVELETMRVEDDAVARFLATQQATATMDAREVREKRGQTIGETLKELPGVAVIQYGPSIAKPVVRGLSSQRIATVNGGVPQEGQQWGGEHAPEIDAFAANEIEVIRGPGTLLYGPGALGGVVRVKPRPLPTSGVLDGEVSTNAFLNNRQGAASIMLEGAELRLPLLGKLGWRAQVSARKAGDAKAPLYYLPNTGFRELNYSGVVGMTRSWGQSDITFSHFGTNLGLYVGAHVGNLDDLERAMQNAYTTDSFSYGLGTPKQIVTHDLLAWHTHLLLPNAARVEVSYGFQYNNRREYDSRGFAAGTGRPAFALELFTHSLDVQYHHAQTSRLSGVFGFSGLRQGNLSPGRSFLIPQYRIYSGGVFGLETLELSRLTLTAGARFDYRYQHAFQYGAPVVISPDDERRYSGGSGTVGATWHLSNSWSLAGTGALAWRPPNVNERFSQGVHHGTAQFEIGDSSLTPEQSLNVDATLRHQGARTRLELSGYVNRINDYIFLGPREPVVTVRGTYPAYNYASANALLRGTEVTLQYAPSSWLQLYANGNLVRGIDRATRTPLYDMPADRVTTSARFFAASSRRITAPFLEVGGTLVRQQDHLPLATIYRLPTAGYALLNIELGAAALRLGHLTLQPNLSVRNVLDARYRDYLSRYRLFVDDTGRDVVLRITAPFGRSPKPS